MSILSTFPHILQNPLPEATLSLLCSLFENPSQPAAKDSSVLLRILTVPDPDPTLTPGEASVDRISAQLMGSGLASGGQKSY